MNVASVLFSLVNVIIVSKTGGSTEELAVTLSFNMWNMLFTVKRGNSAGKMTMNNTLDHLQLYSDSPAVKEQIQVGSLCVCLLAYRDRAVLGSPLHPCLMFFLM